MEGRLVQNQLEREYHLGIFDLLKGYAMISIVVFHTSINFNEQAAGLIGDRVGLQLLEQLYYQIPLLMNCCILLFFMISGFGFRPSDGRTCLKKQAKTLLLPYAICGVVEIVTCLFTYGFFETGFTKELWFHVYRRILGYVLGIINDTTAFGYSVKGVGPVWFLAALFLSWNILNALMQRLSQKQTAVVVGLITVFGFVIANVMQPFYFVCQGMMGTGFLYLGYLMREKRLLLKKHPWWIWVLLGIGSFISIVFGYFGIAGYVWKLGFLELVFGGCSAYLLMYLAVGVDDAIGEWADGIRTIGRYSLWIMCCHTIENQGMPWYLMKDLFGDHVIAGVLCMVCIKGICIYLMYRLLMRIQKWQKKRRRTKRKQERNEKYVRDNC